MLRSGECHALRRKWRGEWLAERLLQRKEEGGGGGDAVGEEGDGAFVGGVRVRVFAGVCFGHVCVRAGGVCVDVVVAVGLDVAVQPSVQGGAPCGGGEGEN